MHPKSAKFLWWSLGALGILFLVSSLVIASVEYARFQNQTLIFPEASLIGGVPVGGLTEAEAVDRVQTHYQAPIRMVLHNETIELSPEALGFSMDAAGMVGAGLAEIEKANFWDFLWQKPGNTTPIAVPLSAKVDEAHLATFLESEIVPRYIHASTPVVPIPFTTNYTSQQPGEALDIDSAVVDIAAALKSPDRKPVPLHVTPTMNAAPSTEMLAAFLQHQIELSGFDGLVEVYVESLTSEQTLHFATLNGKTVQPDIAFTAASTIKIPILIAVLRRLPEPTPPEAVTLLEQMIILSENPPADTLMETYLDPVRGPLMVSEDMAAMGLENSFLAGYFYLGAPLLKQFNTPANQRTDVFLDPDIYSQTVPGEAGQLMAGIYTCAQEGAGLLIDTFPGEITQTECQLMFDILKKNKIGLLIEAGLPPEAQLAHKHGWTQELDGLLHSMSDTAIVTTPGADFVLNIFIHSQQRLDFDQGNRLVARLAQTVYNFFNLEHQAYWWMD